MTFQPDQKDCVLLKNILKLIDSTVDHYTGIDILGDVAAELTEEGVSKALAVVKHIQDHLDSRKDNLVTKKIS